MSQGILNKEDERINPLDADVVSSTNIHTGIKEINVVSKGHVCVDNTTTTPLGVNEIFTGNWQDTLDYSEIIVSVFASVPSITDGLIVEWSSNAVDVHGDDVFTISASSGKTFSFPCQNRYVRVTYKNDGVAQTQFSLETLLKRFASKGSSHRLKDTLVQEDDAIVTKSLVAGKTTGGGGGIVDVKVNPSGALTVESIIKDVAGNQINPATKENQTNGSQLTQIVDPDNASRKSEFDGVFQAPISIDVAHHEIHEGGVFSYCDVVSLANGATQDYMVTTPNTTKWAHFGYMIDFNDGAGSFDIYEATDRNGTTAQTIYNRNRNSESTAGVTIHKSVSGGTTDGVRLCMRRAGSGKTLSGSIGSGSERILKQNTKYLIRLTNNTTSTNNASVEFDWYEHASE